MGKSKNSVRKFWTKQWIQFVVLCCCIYAYPQDTLPPVYLLNADTSFSRQPDFTYYEVLEDTGGKFNIQDVTNLPLIKNFHRYGADTAGLSKKNISVFWTRFQLENTTENAIKITLQENQDKFDVFVRGKGNDWQHLRSGIMTRKKYKDGFAAFNAVPITIEAGEKILIYTRQSLKKNFAYPSPLVIYNTDRFIEKYYVAKVENQSVAYGFNHLLESFIIGVLLITFMFKVYFYLVVKEKLYLYFALSLFFLAINRNYNILAEYTRLENPDWRWLIGIISVAWLFIYAFLILFFREAFKTKIFFPRWDKFLLTILIVHIVSYIVFLLSGNLRWARNIFGLLLMIMSTPVIPVSLFITTMFYVKSKEQFYKLLAIAAFPLLSFYGFIGLFTDNKTWVGEKESLPKIIQWFITNFRSVEVFCLIWFVLFFTWLLFVRFDKLRKENTQRQLDIERVAREREVEKNELISKQKEQLELEVAERTADLKLSLESLKATQSQLIQAEKLASLGELTAGIAHEIQNPLNFVNNFSDVNRELIDELVTEAESGNIAEVKFIAADIKSNEEKINHHGRRADSIVKGMLQHSRTGRGEKEPTNINELADEYLRLSYHGLRSKDNRFNADIITNFDSSIGKIDVVQQDISRVLLNLFNNAFYALNEKKKTDPDFNPQLTVTSFKKTGAIEIIVMDNGDGIPENVIDKIFQPFFTTKPTGQGTGLGLSLSYDIIKAHGGEIDVQNVNGEGAKFTITLPALETIPVRLT